jgi:sugar phosphate isomerase/epimerase
VTLGRMNNPSVALPEEIALTARLGFDYLELTLEPPGAAAEDLDAREVAARLRDAGLGVVGHTAWFLPLADIFPRVRRAAIDQLRVDLDFLAAVGADRCTIHPHRARGVSGAAAERMKGSAEALAVLVEHGREVGVTAMVENLDDNLFGDPALMKKHLFGPVPELRLTLDLGHAGIGVPVNRTPRFLELLGDRLHHVHVSDNDTRQDLHLPLGSSRQPLKKMVRAVRQAGYDAGITLEVFGTSSDYVAFSRELMTRWWQDGETMASEAAEAGPDGA